MNTLKLPNLPAISSIDDEVLVIELNLIPVKQIHLGVRIIKLLAHTKKNVRLQRLTQVGLNRND